MDSGAHKQSECRVDGLMYLFLECVLDLITARITAIKSYSEAKTSDNAFLITPVSVSCFLQFCCESEHWSIVYIDSPVPRSCRKTMPETINSNNGNVPKIRHSSQSVWALSFQIDACEIMLFINTE